MPRVSAWRLGARSIQASRISGAPRRAASARGLNRRTPKGKAMLESKSPFDSDVEDCPALVLPTDGRIVGIGASAGGLEALEQLFDALPADTGMAFIVVQHLSPDF